MLVFGNTTRSFLSQSWKALQQAEVAVPSMTGICTSLAESWAQWQDWRSDASAHRAPLPMGWEEKLNRFQKMIVVRTLAEVSERSEHKATGNTNDRTPSTTGSVARFGQRFLQGCSRVVVRPADQVRRY